MVAHLTLGGLLSGKGKAEVRAMLGTPDCGSQEAWDLGFASTAIDPDCLHVEYGPQGLVTRAYVQTH